MNVITPVDGTNNIRIADFVRINTGAQVYRFCTAPSNITVPAVDAIAFDAVGALMKVGDVQRDIKSTGNDTSVSLTGIDTSVLGFVLSNTVKGSYIQLWHGFFDTDGALITTGGTGGLYQFFSGYVTSFSIQENWMEEARTFVGTVQIGASSTQMTLQNTTSGRYTNDDSWQFFNNGDSSMNRVSFIETIAYQFGKRE
jgi:hypothetical protein